MPLARALPAAALIVLAIVSAGVTRSQESGAGEGGVFHGDISDARQAGIRAGYEAVADWFEATYDVPTGSHSIHIGSDLRAIADTILTQGIFVAIPQAQAIWVWDAHRHRWRFARSGDSVSGDLEHLRTGMGFSMRVGGRDPIQWERRLAMTDSAITSSTTYVSLASGRNLVSWAGWPRSLRAPGDDLMSVFSCDAGRQDWSAPLVADEDGFTPESMRIARRDAVAVNSAQAGLWRQFVRRWWPEVRVRDRWIEETRCLGDVSAAGQNPVREHAADVEAFVGDPVGTSSTPQVYVAADFESSAAMHQEVFGTGGSGFCGEADPREILLRLTCHRDDSIGMALFAHEHFHISQTDRYQDRCYVDG